MCVCVCVAEVECAAAMQGHRGAAQQYIATQAPMESTAEDFWRMVWENKSDIVIMATNFQERGIVSVTHLVNDVTVMS